MRAIRKEGGSVTCVVTEAGTQFVTPLSLGALSERPVYTTLFDLKNEVEMGHIQLSREADLVVVCPATADMMAKMAHGIADDLATTLLLATDKPVLAVPAMNVRMWQHAATTRNVQVLRSAGVDVMEPDEGTMACGEYGPGRLPDPDKIWQRIAWSLGLGPVDIAPVPGGEEVQAGSGLGGLTSAHVGRVVAQPAPVGRDSLLAAKGEARGAASSDPGAIDLFIPPADGPLSGRHVLVTAGPTHEPIDPVRYIANRSSGKQGFAIAAAAAQAGAHVTLVAGPVTLSTPPGVTRVDVESAREMLAAVEAALPADIAVMVAAVADWRTAEVSGQKIKKQGEAANRVPPPLVLAENPDILATLCASPRRPALVVGFAAETNDVLSHAAAKRARKGADWIVANDVSGDVMGGDANTVHIVSGEGVLSLPEMPKGEVARALIARIAETISDTRRTSDAHP
ncbi:bifunctional phosphopantothenoylcysteine decarboxylase/phosphopantothenate synthase [Novosphingobium sp. 9]|uniref:bifunctional phosphopantothenoylcysteine decarboxylase/phosphopantothenate synthase n=1 Tax=Novosphingobium sp. 9 TaxID=2025349 RepID=UPI0021B4F64C|nr:bifunctional phosphopantothenoylcysteine decarboxylase/phosphopantothenate synthase [Novosphingobium sp. 9]